MFGHSVKAAEILSDNSKFCSGEDQED